MPSDSVSRTSALADEQRAPSLFALLTTPRFAPLFLTLCLGAFNGGLWLTTLVVLSAPSAAGSAPLAQWLAAAFSPAIVGAAAAGRLVDRFDAATLARIAKLIELMAVGLGAYGVLTPSPGAQLGTLALLGLQFAWCDPLQNAILPQHLRHDELVGGNALIKTGTTAALAAGAMAATLLAARGTNWVAMSGVLVTLAGLVASRGIASNPPPLPRLRVGHRPCGELQRHLGLFRRLPGVSPAMLGLAWCWLCGTLLLIRLVGPLPFALPGAQGSALLPAIVCSGGIAVGALLGARLSGRQVDVGALPFAAMGLALLALDLALTFPGTRPSGSWRMLFELAALGAFFGLFDVQARALTQEHAAAQQRGRSASLATLIKAVALLVGVLLALGGPADRVELTWLLAASAVGFATLAAFAYAQDPHRSLRFLTDLLIHSFYRLGKQGFVHIPASGPAVLVCNHVSFVDSVVIMAAVRRPIRFVIDHRIYETPLANTLFRHSRTIPIATAKESPEQKEAAFAEVALALRAGELIGLFPEGGITRTGELSHFRYGVGRIVAETPVPVIPMALRGLWGSFYSRRYGPAMSKPSRLRFFAPIELVAGQAVPAQSVTPEVLQRLVAQLRGDWR